MQTKQYFKYCPKCGKFLKIDDIDYNFEGNQDESLFCLECGIFVYSKIRYKRICYAKIEEMDADTKKVYKNYNY